METIYIARKAQNNAKAFITMNPANGNISVHGKFYDGCKAFSGPMLENIAAVPETLMEEIKRSVARTSGFHYLGLDKSRRNGTVVQVLTNTMFPGDFGAVRPL